VAACLLEAMATSRITPQENAKTVMVITEDCEALAASVQLPALAVAVCILTNFEKKTDAVRVHGTEKQASLLQILELNDDLQ